MNRSVLLALGISGLLATWMLTGGHAQKNETPVPIKAPLMKVVVTPSLAQSIEQFITLNGQAKPDKSATLKAEITVVVDKVLVKEGDLVKKGDRLVAFKMSDRMARLEEAKTKITDEEATLKAMSSLRLQGFSAKTKYYEAKAELAKAKARLLGVQIEISKTNVVAPFDGIVSEINVEAGDYLKPADKVGFILNNNPLIIEAYLPQKDITQLHMNDKAHITLASGYPLLGKIHFIAPMADKNSRMFKVEAMALNPNNYRSGVSAKLQIATQKIKAHFISPAQLSINMQGVMGIKTVDKNNIVHFQKVTIAQSNSKGLWLSHLPEKLSIISVGQGFVEPGEKVLPFEKGAIDEKNH